MYYFLMSLTVKYLWVGGVYMQYYLVQNFFSSNILCVLCVCVLSLFDFFVPNYTPIISLFSRLFLQQKYPNML